MVVVVLIVAFLLAPVCNGFSPHYLASLSATATSSMDHGEITKSAALVILRDYLLDNPNSLVDSSGVINSLSSDASARDLFAAYYHGERSCGLRLQCTSVAFRFSRAIDDIQDANANTDIAESDKYEAHFDNENIPQGQNRLLELKRIIESHIENGLFEDARRETGRALHTLQDFYSHSNWVELGNTRPWEVLGVPGRSLSNLAGAGVRTCVDCERGDDVGIIFGVAGKLTGLVEAVREYVCMDNIVSDLEAQNLITTGYVSNTDEQVKPPGKCSHGGIIDGTSDVSPEGGINKDLKTNTFSPHHYLHDQAAAVAVQATTAFFEGIRENVGDEAFADYFDIQDLRTSLAFVVDTTESLSEELPRIQSSLGRIEQEVADYRMAVGGSVNVDYILVPYNDPDPGVVEKTDSIATLIDFLEALTISGGGDCAEPSIGALIRAAQNSRARGIINLYTDAPPSDEERLPELESILRERDLIVNVFELTGPSSCNQRKRSVRRQRRQTQNVDAYELLTSLTGGRKLKLVPDDLVDVDLIIFSSFRPSTSPVYQEVGVSSGFEVQEVEFSVDSTVTQLQIIVNGNNLRSLTLQTPQGGDGRTLSSTMESVSSSTLYLATVNINENNLNGVWRLSFNSSDAYRVYISVDSSLQLSYTLYRVNKAARTALEEVFNKPLQGESLVLSVFVDEEVEAANVTSAAILSPDGTTLDTLQLNYSEGGNYLAFFDAPSSLFQIQLTGVDSQDIPFTRIDRTGVDPSDVKVALGNGQSPIQQLRSDESLTLNLTLFNRGASSTFTIVATASPASSGFTYTIGSPPATRQVVEIESNSEATLTLQINANERISEANFLSLLVSMYDPNESQRSNYLTVNIEGTSLNGSSSMHGSSVVWVLLLCSALFLFLRHCN